MKVLDAANIWSVRAGKPTMWRDKPNTYGLDKIILYKLGAFYRVMEKNIK